MMKAAASIIHNIPDVGEKSFGLGQVALNLVYEQINSGYDIKIWCLSTAEEVKLALTTAKIPQDTIIRFLPLGPQRLALSPAMIKAAIKGDDQVDLIHQHGIWTLNSCVTRILNKRQRAPYIIAPHGSLEGWALKQSRWKKKIALTAYERANLFGADCIHAVSEAEISDIRDYGLTCPIALIPNCISDQWLNWGGASDSFRERYSIPADRRVLLFLSRITPKKGLIMLAQAINAIRKEFSDWLLVVAGIDEFGHRQKVEAIVEQLDLNKMIKFVGPLYNQQKRDAFAAAELFILPSHSEGAPIVILESLGARVPVITTKASPWKELIENACGWWADASIGGISEALLEAIHIPNEQLASMGNRGYQLVKNQYTWANSAQKTIEMYEWILGRSARPSFVTIW